MGQKDYQKPGRLDRVLYGYKYFVVNRCSEILPVSIRSKNNDSAMTLSELFQILKHRHIYELSVQFKVMLKVLTSNPSDTMRGTISHVSFKM